MNYSEMSDFEINCAVAKHFGEHVFLNIFNEPVSLEADPAATYTGKDFEEVAFDPCNSWADAGPIIAANKISLDFDADGYEPPRYAWCKASSPCGQVYYGGESQPLRAAMIVFLMMQEEK